ncbi:hypothetical protein CPC16_007362 [Podila verticillata]|nr:hypothetical protein BGZ52_004016 [Haplosporangium bisporale]KAF9216580.1 hypothetical protein BGZ59_009091 [Podila verticillata]KAF9386832.1 hypothetical protein CPC16_007362 [Podila verticillata]KFH71107.1 hypothetical protein MVEG_03953 [Podila verticillata NRRL 6337]
MAPPRTRTVKARPAAGANPAAAAAAAAASRRINNSSAIERAPHVLDPEGDANAEVSMEVDQETVDAKAWIKENVEQEVARIEATGTKITSMKVKNFGVVVDLSRKKPTAINRIEIDTTFDFKKVQQIMVSPGVSYPHKENFEYVNVLLFTDNTEPPMIVPYLYDTKFKTQEPVEEPEDGSSIATTEENNRPWINVKNNLTEWLLVNSQHMRARHHIDEFHDI